MWASGEIRNTRRLNSKYLVWSESSRGGTWSGERVDDKNAKLLGESVATLRPELSIQRPTDRPAKTEEHFALIKQ